MMRLLLALAFLLGMLSGLYLTTTIQEGHAQSPEVASAIHTAAIRHGVSEPWLRQIAWCESRFSSWATSHGGHQGLFQYAPGTWVTFSRWAGYAGASPYDPWAAADVTAWAISRGYARHWSCA